MKSILVCLLISFCFALLVDNLNSRRKDELRAGWGKSPALVRMQGGSSALYYPAEE